MWNIKKKDFIKLVNENLQFLFFLENTDILLTQYIYINLNKIIKLNTNFVLKKNKKNRNINNYIKIVFGNWHNLFDNLDNYTLDKSFLKLNYMNAII